MKLSLTSRSQESVLAFDEEDQRRTEEIKAELLLSTKKSAPAKVQTTKPAALERVFEVGDKCCCLACRLKMMNYIPARFLKISA